MEKLKSMCHNVQQIDGVFIVNLFKRLLYTCTFSTFD